VAAPSRKLNEEWQCSSAHGTVPADRDAGRRDLACRPAAEAPAAGDPAAGDPAPVPQDIRRCNSRQESGGLSQPFKDIQKYVCPESATYAAGVDRYRLVLVFPWRYLLPARCGACAGFQRARLPSPRNSGRTFQPGP